MARRTTSFIAKYGPAGAAFVSALQKKSRASRTVEHIRRKLIASNSPAIALKRKDPKDERG